MSSQPRIVVVGSYAVGLVMRTEVIPGAGETVLGRDFRAMDGGKGSNQAVACARLGAHTIFVATVGDDAYGTDGISMLALNGVDTRFVRRSPGAATGVGFIIVDDAGENAIAVDLGANTLLSSADIDRAEDAIADADTLLVSLEIPIETALHAIAIAHRHGVRTVLNPAPAPVLPSGGLKGVDVLTPNLSEARTLSGLRTAAPESLAVALLGAGAGCVVVTLGEQGALIAGADGTRRVEARRVAAVDSTGAGDAFAAALAVGLGEGMGIDEGVRMACDAGAYAVRTVGTVPSYPRRAELARFAGAFAALEAERRPVEKGG